MKVVCIETEADGHLVINKIYDAELTHIMYDPVTFYPKQFLKIKCEDNVWRRFQKKLFISVDEWRERQLNKIGLQ